MAMVEKLQGSEKKIANVVEWGVKEWLDQPRNHMGKEYRRGLLAHALGLSRERLDNILGEVAGNEAHTIKLNNNV